MPTAELTSGTIGWTFAGWAAATAGADTGNAVWEAWIQTRAGVREIQLAGPDVPRAQKCGLGPIREPQKGSLSATFTVPKSNPNLATILANVVKRELVITRAGVIMFMGPVLTKSGGSGDPAVTFGARTTRWYLEHRLRGGFEPMWGNLLKNPRFDAGLDRWDPLGPGISLDTVLFETGDQSVLIDTEPESAIGQTIYIGSGLDYRLVCEARVWIDSAVTAGAGLTVTVPGVFAGDDFAQMAIDADTPRDTWTSLLVELDIEGRPAARTVNYAVWGADGEIHLDSGVVTLTPKSLVDGIPTPATPKVDQATVIAQLIPSVNQNLYLGVDAPLTGQLVDYDATADVDVMAGAILQRFEDREHGVVITEDWTPRSRTIRTHYPDTAQTWDPDDLALAFTAGDRSGNVIAYSFQGDATRARSRLTLRGEGEDRAVAVDLDAWDGLLLDDVEQAPPNTPLADLPGRAQASLRRDDGEVTSWDLTVQAGLHRLLRRRDIVEATVTDGGVLLDHQMVRVVERTITPENDRMKLTVNAEPAP